MGWHAEGRFPAVPKVIIIVAPHTSNWDFPIGLFIAFVLKADVHWLGKHTLFKKPFEHIVRYFGGIPVDRSQSHGIVKQTIQWFQASEQLKLAIAPAGTRRRVRSWKTGFYHIACGAQIPIALAYIDYGRKAGGIGPLMIPSKDFETDMKQIHSFYSQFRGRFPEKSIGKVIS